MFFCEFKNIKTIILWWLFIFNTTAFGADRVKYVAILFRHGDRTPVSTYPTDPYKNESLWPVRFGELTNIGKLQHFNFGKWIREKYGHLVSEVFNPTEIYVRSTDVDRTLMSAQANLAGLYPPIGTAVWKKDLMWQPIPVHTVPEKDDDLLAMKKSCPAYDEERDKYYGSTDFRTRLSYYEPLMNYLSAYTGMSVTSYSDILDLYSTLTIEAQYNFTLPNWTRHIFPYKMREPACYSFRTETGTALMARLKAGPILKHIHTYMMKAVGNKTTTHPKLHLYSAHDLNIGNVLNALGLYDGNCPCYTSAIFFELLIDEKSRHFVRILYRNTTGIAEPIVMSIPYCGTKCPVERYTALYDNLLTVDLDYDCNNRFSPILIAAPAIVSFIGVAVFLVYKIKSSRVHHRERIHHFAYADIFTTSTASPKLAA